MALTVIFLTSIMATDLSEGGTAPSAGGPGFRGTRVVKGRGTVICPMVEACRELSLELMSFDVAPEQDLYT